MLIYLWKSTSPLKLVIFSWQLLLGRLPTRDNLHHRGLFGWMETWVVRFVIWILNPFPIFSYNVLLPFPSGLLFYNGLGLIFQVQILLLASWFSLEMRLIIRWIKAAGCCFGMQWCIWELQNGIIFGNDSADLIYLLDKLKVCSWRQFLARACGVFYSFSDWCIDLVKCFAK